MDLHKNKVDRYLFQPVTKLFLPSSGGISTLSYLDRSQQFLLQFLFNSPPTPAFFYSVTFLFVDLALSFLPPECYKIERSIKMLGEESEWSASPDPQCKLYTWPIASYYRFRFINIKFISVLLIFFYEIFQDYLCSISRIRYNCVLI